MKQYPETFNKGKGLFAIHVVRVQEIRVNGISENRWKEWNAVCDPANFCQFMNLPPYEVKLQVFGNKIISRYFPFILREKIYIWGINKNLVKLNLDAVIFSYIEPEIEHIF